jgi:alcohol dehydrogenase YqhD (iron-dependent ADH family)
MENFEFYVGTKILFGKGQIENLPGKLGQYGKRVLLAYGGGSIKKTGLYDKIKNLLSDFEVYDFAGIEPNPKIQSIYAGKDMCLKHNIDIILAVGGGSVIDCAKGIAAAARYDGDAREFLGKDKITGSIPLAVILTLSGSSSEFDFGGVISVPETNEKLVFEHESLYPKFSILDPEYTFTVPKLLTAAGSADAIIHVLDQYFTDVYSMMTDRISEGIMQTVIRYAPTAVNNPDDYEARAEIMWASALTNTHICSIGNINYAWSIHSIEHSLTAHYDSLTHGVGCAIITPHWMRYVLSDKTVDRFAQYGIRVWEIDKNLDKYTIANQAIDKTEAFFKSLGIPMKLSEYNITSDKFETIAEDVLNTRDDYLGKLDRDGWVPLGVKDVIKILNMCL